MRVHMLQAAALTRQRAVVPVPASAVLTLAWARDAPDCGCEKGSTQSYDKGTPARSLGAGICSLRFTIGSLRFLFGRSRGYGSIRTTRGGIHARASQNARLEQSQQTVYRAILNWTT